MPRILLVEDNPVTRRMYRLVLEADGFDVLEAPSAQTALDLASTARPDIVLQDLLVPGSDGPTLCTRLRALQGTPMLVVACSGSLERMEEARAAGAGFDGFLLKPVEPSRLLRVLRGFLEA